MANISVSLPSDGETIDAADYNTPITTIVNEINGSLDNSNIASGAAIAGSKLADNSVTAQKTAFGGNYTTSEVDTGFTWVDGKTIYKKTFAVASFPNNSTANVAHGVSDLETLVEITGRIQESSTVEASLPWVIPTSLAACVGVWIDGASIKVQTGVNRSSNSGHITIFYTKSS